jgi:hypothetical protein
VKQLKQYECRVENLPSRVHTVEELHRFFIALGCRASVWIVGRTLLVRVPWRMRKSIRARLKARVGDKNTAKVFGLLLPWECRGAVMSRIRVI